MRTQQDMQVALRERYRRCLVQEFDGLAHETQMTRNWIRAQPQLAAILNEAARVEPDLDPANWLNGGRRGLTWPSKTEAGRATLAWGVINSIAEDPEGSQAILNYGHPLSSSTRLVEIARALVERIYAPLFDYLIDNVAAESSVLFTLDRFVRSIEWFTREELFADYEADTGKGEAVYDKALRQFLFNEGINMPYSQVKSPSGVADVLTDLEREDPLVCEVKLLVGDKRPLGTGLNQAVMYAADHGKTTAYLVIVNLTDRNLELPTDGDEKQAPRYVDVGGIRVYLIPVRALPPPTSASKAGKPKPLVITREDLTSPD